MTVQLSAISKVVGIPFFGKFSVLLRGDTEQDAFP